MLLEERYLHSFVIQSNSVNSEGVKSESLFLSRRK